MIFKNKTEDFSRLILTSTIIAVLTISTYALAIFSTFYYKKLFYTIFSILNILLIAFLTLASCKRGFIKDSDSKPLIAGRCIKCKRFKPERAHHCSKCKTCVKKMDHHCIWIGACVNNDNVAYFIRFLFLCSTTAFLSFLFCLQIIYQYVKFGQIYAHIYLFIYFCVHLIGVGGASTATFMFFLVNLRFVVLNMTFIEKCMIDDMVAFGMEVPRNPYDFGFTKNLINSLGKPYFLFLFGEKTGNGIQFDKAFPANEWPPVKIPKWNHCEI